MFSIFDPSITVAHLDPILDGLYKDLRLDGYSCFLTVHEALRYIYYQYNKYLKF